MFIEVLGTIAAEPSEGKSRRSAMERCAVELIARGPFHVELSKIYPLDATARALRDVQRHHIGKLAIKI